MASRFESEQALLQRVSAWQKFPTLAALDAASLQEITRQHGVDFATALLYDRLRRCPTHASFIERIETLLATPQVEPLNTDWKIVIVPGALYVERPALGSDGKVVREAAAELSLPCNFVPLASRGSVQQNATLLAEWLKHQPAGKLVLVTVSKGGPDLKLALARPDAPQLFRNVVAWVNLCGPLDGTPMADWIPASRVRSWVMRLQYRIQRRDFGFITDMCHAPGSPLCGAVRLPTHMKLWSFVGFPLRAHLATPHSRFCNRIIARLGPNDGTVLLSDALKWPGELFPVWGVDHYFRPTQRAKSLVNAIFRHLDEVCRT